MDLIDRLRDHSANAARVLNKLDTEEATKNALVLPLINALGYNVFDPHEVVPEFTADVGVKKGEKVDYAIFEDGKPIILFECKAAHANLDKQHASQLYRYFSVTDARFGILTNGVQYRVFSDLEAANKMDGRPFLEFSLLDITDETVGQLKKFAKGSFNLDEILSTATELKYTRGIKRALMEEWMNPSEDFVKIFAGRVYQGRLTQGAKEQFTDIVKRAFHGFVNDRIKDRLKTALASSDDGAEKDDKIIVEPNGDGSGIDTTEDELEGFYIVKSICREVVDVSRIFMRDTQSYCGILLDDNNRKPICRLFFNSSKKYFGTFDADKRITRHAIEDLNDIFLYADLIKTTAANYDGSRARE